MQAPGDGVMLLSPDEMAFAGVFCHYFSQPVKPDQFAASLLEEPGVEREILSQGMITLGDGTPAIEVISQEGAEGMKFVNKEVIVVRETQGLVMFGRASAAYWDAHVEELDSILGKLKLIPVPMPFPTPTPAPSTGQEGVYVNQEYGFSITYPASWDMPPMKGGNVFEVTAPGDVAGVSMSVKPSDGATSVVEEAAGFVKAITENLPDTEIISRGEVPLADGTPAYEVVYTGTPFWTMGLKAKFKMLLVLGEEHLFFIQAYTSPEEFSQREAEIDSVLYSFRLE